MKAKVIVIIHSTQIMYLTQSTFLLLTFLSVICRQQHSCRPPEGHIHPQKALPKTNDKTNWAANTKKLPVTMPEKPPVIIRTGEK